MGGWKGGVEWCAVVKGGGAGCNGIFAILLGHVLILTRHLHFWLNDPDHSRATAVK